MAKAPASSRVDLWPGCVRERDRHETHRREPAIHGRLCRSGLPAVPKNAAAEVLDHKCPHPRRAQRRVLLLITTQKDPVRHARSAGRESERRSRAGRRSDRRKRTGPESLRAGGGPPAKDQIFRAASVSGGYSAGTGEASVTTPTGSTPDPVSAGASLPGQRCRLV